MKQVLIISGLTLFLGSAWADAATLFVQTNSTGVTKPSSGGLLGDRDDDYTNALVKKIAEAQTSYTGKNKDTGEAVTESLSRASVNYNTGEVKALAEAEAFELLNTGVMSTANAQARFYDELTFTIDPTAVSRNVTFLWQVERTVFGEGTVRTLGSINDGYFSNGNQLAKFDETFLTSGTTLFEWTIALPEYPSVDTSIIRFDFRLNANAKAVCHFPCADPASDFIPSSLADAGNTGIFNIITPEGISFEGTGGEFLSQMRQIQAVPLPGSLSLLLLSGIGFAACRRRKRL